jgi:hypothetical protein
MIKKNRITLWLPRLVLALNYSWTIILKTIKWSLSSRETSTYTYLLSPNNTKYLIHSVSLVTKKSFLEIEGYFNEILSNKELKSYIIDKIKSSSVRYKKDLRFDLASRIGWYAIIRANKSKVVVENGIELGYTAIVLCEAILKNKSEGFDGSYYGLDINSEAGYFIKHDKYETIANLIVGDALDSLAHFKESVDFYFSDGYRTCDYERKEFEALLKKTSSHAVIITNKLKFSDALSDASLLYNKQFITFQEDPLNHWYPGSSIGISF